ncbi:MAG TPA: hypothetical protein VHT91_14665 [Kofleriaceae bacterium]|jgi:hypothetical protein|nr:hypothetical protein [Kofleriaceae bacterium]
MSTTKPSPRAPTLADLDALLPGIVGEIAPVAGVITEVTARYRLIAPGG